MYHSAMKPVAILYATREGHTRKVAERLAEDLRKQGLTVETKDLAQSPDADPEAYQGLVLAASVHAGHHEKELVEFVKRHLAQLQRMPAAFISVTLSEAGVERKDTTPEEHARFAADVEKMLNDFSVETGWMPAMVKPVAGALLYSKYNFMLRFIMKRIAKQSGGSTDTSQDHVYTDWLELDHFAEVLAKQFLPAKVVGQMG
jgi:menaquinone-dependent protoporphyrinogen oxidase